MNQMLVAHQTKKSTNILKPNIMARNNGYINLDGTLGGLTFYRSNGISLVKTKNNVSKNRIMYDPAYRRTRENAQEFGGASRVGKAFREAFASVEKTMGDTYISGRMGGLMKRVNNNGSGIRGERNFDLVANSTLFHGFEFNKNTPFNAQFFAPSTGVTLNPARNIASWSIPDFNPENLIRNPESATHFKLVLAAGYVSNYAFQPATKSYEPIDPSLNGEGAVAYSANIPLTGMVGASTDLLVDLSAFGAIPATSLLFAATGIQFYQEINGTFYKFAQGNAMKIATTG
jgi:hypothetical protein